MSYPTIDSRLVDYTTNFDAVLTADYAVYQLTLEQATQYTTLSQAYVSAARALGTARAKGTRSEQLTTARDTARKNLLAYGRSLYKMVQGNASISDEAKIALGVHVPKSRSDQPRPTSAPTVAITDVTARTVKFRIYDPTSASKRSKGQYATGALIYSYIGEDYPADPAGWTFHGPSTTFSNEITFPSTTAGGTQVWIMAAWVNRKLQSGPPANPVSTYLQGGGAQVSQGEMRLAA